MATVESAGGTDIVDVLASAAQQLERSSESSEAETLDLIVSAAVDTVPGAEHAGIFTLDRDGNLTPAARTGEIVSEIERLKSVHREGPSVTALWEQPTVMVDDLAEEAHRWPEFAPGAVAAGVVSLLSFRLFARQGTLGVLDLYSSTRKGFSEESQALGGLFATHAARALGEARNLAQLHRAMGSRDLIGQAKGMLMERFGISADEAFDLLVRSSQHTNMKLTGVAEWLTGGESPQE